MMKNDEEHELIEVDLMDAYYGEKELSEDLKKHINTCPKCAAFWEKLSVLGDNLSIPDTEIEVDERIIRRAFSEAGKIRAKKREIRDFAVFLLTAAAFLGIVGWLAYIGYGMQIIAVQFLFIIVAPISIPVLIWRRLAKEGQK